MPKRKREDDFVDDHHSAVQGSAQQQRIQHKLHHGIVKLGHAFKIAKGLERQKLGRRRKHDLADKSGKDVQRIDKEIEALKALENGQCARSHLYKSLLRIKAVAMSEDLSEDVKKPIKVAEPTDTAALNVHARLCNSNPVKETLSTVLVDVVKALGVKLKKEDAGKKSRVRAKDYEGMAARNAAKPSHGGDPGLGGDESGQGEDEDEDEDADMEAYGDRLAPSDEDDGSEFSDVEESSGKLAGKGVRRTSKTTNGDYNIAVDLSLPQSEEPSASPSPEPQKGPAPKRSAFLPSLTLGGYISGSDVDDDDVDVAPKKNRRGQRARQQIWEKKFGVKAKHVQKGGNPGERAKGWDPKRGATDGGGFRKGLKPLERNDSASTNRRENGGKNDARKTTKDAGSKAIHRDDSGPIHPSWAAAKLAKEKKDAPVAFQGKKITFD